MTFINLEHFFNSKKKIIIGLLVCIVLSLIGMSILIQIPRSKLLFRKIVSLISILPMLISISLILYSSFIKPVFSFKYPAIQFIISFLITYASIFLYIFLNRTKIAGLVSLITSFIAFMLTGSIIQTSNVFIFYIHLILNWSISRFILILFIFINYIDLYIYLYKLLLKAV